MTKKTKQTNKTKSIKKENVMPKKKLLNIVVDDNDRHHIGIDSIEAIGYGALRFFFFFLELKTLLFKGRKVL